MKRFQVSGFRLRFGVAVVFMVPVVSIVTIVRLRISGYRLKKVLSVKC